MRINTNVSSVISYNALAATNGGLARSIEKLSSGLRIVRASDDAAGLAISEKMRAQYRGLDQATRNAQDGISMVQTAEGALDEVHSILQRMRELSVQAANDTLTQEDRAYIQLEVDELKGEIDRISTTTQFNRKKLLDGSSDALWSTDDLGVRVNVKGSLISRDQFGQVEKFDGNYKFVVASTDAGQGQVQKSNIFTESRTFWIDTDGDGTDDEKVTETKTATLGSVLSDITAFYDKNGKFILDDPQHLTLSIEGAGERTVTIYANDTIEDLGLKINAALMDASGQVPVGSMVQWVGAGGVVSTTIHHDVEPIDEYADMLMNGLIENSAKLILDKYGLQGSGTSGLSVDTLPDTRPTSTYYRELNGNVFDLMYMDVGEDFFQAMDDVKWEEAKIAALREVTRAMEYANKDLLGAMFSIATPGQSKPAIDASWLHEGLIQYIAGGSAVAQAAFGGMTPAQVAGAMSAAVGTGTNTGFSTGAANYAAASYLAARFYDEASGGRLKDLVARLSGGATIDAAIAATSAFGSMAGFRAAVSGAGASADFTTFVAKVMGEDTTVDGGFIGGQFSSNGPAQTRADLAASLMGDRYKANPLAGHGFDDFKIYDYARPTEDILISGGGLLSTSAPKSGTLQGVDGTLLLHSNIAGSAGRISLSGSEELLKALGFAEIRSARDAEYRVSVYDAHSGRMIASDAAFSGTLMTGVLHDELDVVMANNFAIDVEGANTLTGGYGGYVFNKSGGEFIVHAAASSTVLQIGANEGEIFSLSFGDASARSLGVDSVRVTDRELASRAITKIDSAIGQVSSRRARLGSYVNRLEHTISDLTVASTSMKNSESGIRDLDMAREMMAFTKLSILSQAGTSMLSQANQLPNNVLSLLR